MNPTEANNHKSANGSFASLLDRLTGVTPESGAANGNHKGDVSAADFLRAFDSGQPISKTPAKMRPESPAGSRSQAPSPAPLRPNARDARGSADSDQDEGTQLSYERALRLHARHQSTWGRQPGPKSNEIPRPRQILNQAAAPSRPAAKPTDTSLLNAPVKSLDVQGPEYDVFQRIASLASQSVPSTLAPHPPRIPEVRPASVRPPQSSLSLDRGAAKTAPNTRATSSRASSAKAASSLTPAAIRKQGSLRSLPPQSPAFSAKAQARANTNHRTSPHSTQELNPKGRTNPPLKQPSQSSMKASPNGQLTSAQQSTRLASKNVAPKRAASPSQRQVHTAHAKPKTKTAQAPQVISRASSRVTTQGITQAPSRRSSGKPQAANLNETSGERPRPLAASEALEIQIRQLIERLDAMERIPSYAHAEQPYPQNSQQPDQRNLLYKSNEDEPRHEPESAGAFRQAGQFGQAEQFEQAEQASHYEQAEELRLEHRNSTISVRLNEAEFSTLRLRALESGISVSAYMRSCVLEAEQLRAQVKQALAAMRAATVTETDDLDETELTGFTHSQEGSAWWSRLQEYAGNLWRPPTITTLKA